MLFAHGLNIYLSQTWTAVNNFISTRYWIDNILVENKRCKEASLNTYTDSFYVTPDDRSQTFFLVFLPVWKYRHMASDCNIAFSCELGSNRHWAWPWLPWFNNQRKSTFPRASHPIKFFPNIRSPNPILLIKYTSAKDILQYSNVLCWVWEGLHGARITKTHLQGRCHFQWGHPGDHFAALHQLQCKI